MSSSACKRLGPHPTSLLTPLNCCSCRDTLTCAECPEFHHRKYEEGHQEFAVDEVGQILGKCMFDKNELSVGNVVPLIGKPGYNWAGVCLYTRHGNHTTRVELLCVLQRTLHVASRCD